MATIATDVAASALAEHAAEIRIRFVSAEHAEYAARTLQVDAELQAGRAFKECSSEGNELVVKLRATEPRILRVMVSAIYDYVGVIARTHREFG